MSLKARILDELLSGDLSPTGLAQRTGRSLPAISRAIRDLKDHGLIEFLPHAYDGRRRWVRITPAGLQALRKEAEAE